MSYEVFRVQVRVTSGSPSIWGTSGNLDVETPVGGPQTVTGVGIGTAEAIGAATVRNLNTLVASGISTAEAFGTATLSKSNRLIASGIVTAESFGAATVLTLSTLIASGIATAESVGTANVTNVNRLVASGIATAESFGVATILTFRTLVAVGIATEESLGIASVRNVNRLVASGIATAEALGTPTVIIPMWYLLPTGAATAEAFGVAVVTNDGGTQHIVANSAPSQEVFGTATVLRGAVTISAAGAIASLEAFGMPTRILQPYIIGGVGVVSDEVFGTAKLNRYIIASGITSAEAFGTPNFEFATLIFTGVPSEEAFGIAIITGGMRDWYSGNATADITRWITKDLTASKTEERLS